HTLGIRTCIVHASSAYESVSLTLPAGFSGLVTTSSIRGIAPSLPAEFITLREANGEGRYFKGDWGLLQGREEWNGTTVNLDAAGKIKVSFSERKSASPSPLAPIRSQLTGPNCGRLAPHDPQPALLAPPMVTTLDLVPAGSGRRPDENPPPYMDTERKTETDAPEKDWDAVPVTAPLAPDIPRCNLLNISRSDGRSRRVAGQFVVDPALRESNALLAPLLPGGARPNLRLATKRGVDAEVWVLDAGASASAVRLVFVSKREHVRIRL
ncbi:hypothetical protein AURDEDRAFT_132164, partial [Auricularia subglabra TFB-10046 SS5]